MRQLFVYLIKIIVKKLKEEAAVRELKEETGYSVREMHSLGAFYPSFGSTNEKIWLFAAECGETGESARERARL